MFVTAASLPKSWQPSHLHREEGKLNKVWSSSWATKTKNQMPMFPQILFSFSRKSEIDFSNHSVLHYEISTYNPELKYTIFMLVNVV